MKGTLLWAVVLVCVLGLWGVGVAEEAYGWSCGPPAHAVVSSYPADGAEGVPTNLPFFWALSSTWPATVTLNGEPIRSAHHGLYVLPALAPRTRYEVVIKASDESRVSENQPVVLTFTTGDGPQAVPAPPTISIRGVEVMGVNEAFQQNVCAPKFRGCQVSDGYVGIVFDVEAEGEGEIIAWRLMSGEMWPVGCLPPVMVTLDGANGGWSGCLTVLGLDAFGQWVSTQPYCVEPQVGDDVSSAGDVGSGVGEDDGGGCRVVAARGRRGGGGVWWGVGGVAFGGALWRRRRLANR